METRVMVWFSCLFFWFLSSFGFFLFDLRRLASFERWYELAAYGSSVVVVAC